MATGADEEEWAAAAVCIATGATCEAHDHSGRRRAVDFLLHLPGNRLGALEITSHASAGVRETQSLLRRKRFAWPNPGAWNWTIAIDPDANLKRVQAAYGHVITVCERHQVRGPSELPFDLLIADDVLWAAAHDVFGARFYGAVGSRCTTGTVTVLPGAIGGGVDDELTGLPRAVDDLLRVPHVADHVAKVVSHAADEHHLFVLLGPGSIPFAQYYPLCDRVTALPDQRPSAPEGLTHLWLSTGYGPSLVGWNTVSGWTVHDVFNAPPATEPKQTPPGPASC